MRHGLELGCWFSPFTDLLLDRHAGLSFEAARHLLWRSIVWTDDRSILPVRTQISKCE
jgi:hypothetical protein